MHPAREGYVMQEETVPPEEGQVVEPVTEPAPEPAPEPEEDKNRVPQRPEQDPGSSKDSENPEDVSGTQDQGLYAPPTR